KIILAVSNNSVLQSVFITGNRHNGRDTLTKALVGNTEYHAVVNGGMTVEYCFHFLREDFLTSGVDAPGATAHHFQCPVGLDGAHIADKGVPLAIDYPEGFRRLFRILVIGDRYKSTSGGDVAHLS